MNTDLPTREVCTTANHWGHNTADADHPKDWAGAANKPLMRRLKGNESRSLTGMAPMNFKNHPPQEGWGSNGEGQQERDWVMPESHIPVCGFWSGRLPGVAVYSRTRVRETSQVCIRRGRKPVNRGLLCERAISAKTGYEPVEDNRRVPHPMNLPPGCVESKSGLNYDTHAPLSRVARRRNFECCGRSDVRLALKTGSREMPPVASCRRMFKTVPDSILTAMISVEELKPANPLGRKACLSGVLCVRAARQVQRDDPTGSSRERKTSLPSFSFSILTAMDSHESRDELATSQCVLAVKLKVTARLAPLALDMSGQAHQSGVAPSFNSPRHALADLFSKSAAKAEICETARESASDDKRPILGNSFGGGFNLMAMTRELRGLTRNGRKH